jgi:hypothetical protein
VVLFSLTAAAVLVVVVVADVVADVVELIDGLGELG